MSDYNFKKYPTFQPVKLTDRTWPDQVISKAPEWCSVDLRDGNQALIDPMTVSQKQKMFKLLVDVGFKQIEVGFPAASQPDFDFVRWLIEEDQVPEDVTIQVLTQARPELIARSYEALKGAKKAIIHLYNSTSTVQREKVFKMEKDGIVNLAIKGAEEVKRLAAEYPETEWTFQYSPESFTGTELDFAVEICDAVNNVWQPTPEKKTIINLPATVEMSTPNVYADQIEWFCRNLKNRESVVISVHTHNDRGCGVAAAELAVLAGADRVEGTLLGNGERTGNMDIVVMGMNLYSQGIDPELDFSDMDRICNVVQDCTKIDVHPRQPYSGSLVFTAFSGSHQDAIKKCLDMYEEGTTWEIAYLPVDPRDLGRTYQDVIRVNSQSGKGGIAYLLANHGFNIPRWLQVEFSKVVQKHTEKTEKEVASDEIFNLFLESYVTKQSHLTLKDFNIKKSDTEEVITGVIAEENGSFDFEGKGSGLIEAFLDAINKKYGTDLTISEYDKHTLTGSTKSEAVTYLQIKHGNARYTGIAKDRDIVTSSLKAILKAVSSTRKDSSNESSSADIAKYQAVLR